jgi:hypothetical protein
VAACRRKIAKACSGLPAATKGRGGWGRADPVVGRWVVFASGRWHAAARALQVAAHVAVAGCVGGLLIGCWCLGPTGASSLRRRGMDVSCDARWVKVACGRRAGRDGVRALWRDGARVRGCARAVAAPKNWNPCHWQLPRASQGPVASAWPVADGPALGAHRACFFRI